MRRGTGFLALFLRSNESSSQVVAAMGINADGSVPRRPVVVDTISGRGHIPSWGPVQLAAAAEEDDAVIAYRAVEHGPSEDDPTYARPYFRALSADGTRGERSELPGTTDDNFVREWITVTRSGTGLVVTRAHSRPDEDSMALDVWIGCCE